MWWQMEKHAQEGHSRRSGECRTEPERPGPSSVGHETQRRPIFESMGRKVDETKEVHEKNQSEVYAISYLDECTFSRVKIVKRPDTIK